MNNAAGKMGVEAFWPTTFDKECIKCARIVRTFTSDEVAIDAADADSAKKTQDVLRKIPKSAFAQAKGVAVFTVFRTGMGLSGASGSGVVVSKLPSGKWSGPSAILIHTIGFGFLIGIDVYDVVLILRSKRAVEAFYKPKVSLGAELSVSAGPVGNGAILDSGIEASPCWSYTKSKGLFAGVQLDGTIIVERGDENERAYYKRLGTADILARDPPSVAQPLIQTLQLAEGLAADTSVIPPVDPEVVPEVIKEAHYEGAVWYPTEYKTPPKVTVVAPKSPLSPSPPPPLKVDTRRTSAVYYPGRNVDIE